MLSGGYPIRKMERINPFGQDLIQRIYTTSADLESELDNRFHTGVGSDG